MSDYETTIGYGESTDANGDHYFVGFGEVTDPETGSTVTSLGVHADVSDTGLHLDAAGGKFDIQSADGYGGQVAGFTATGEAVWDNNGYYGLGGTANIIEGGGNYGAPKGDASTDDDVFIKGGASYGAGYAGRVYGGTDVDGDGSLEYGFGFDAGPVGADIRIEEGAATAAYDYAAETASSGYDYVAENASAGYDYAAETASEGYDYASQTASDAYDTAAQTASDTYDSAAETANETYEAVTEYFSSDDEQ